MAVAPLTRANDLLSLFFDPPRLSLYRLWFLPHQRLDLGRGGFFMHNAGFSARTAESARTWFRASNRLSWASEF